MAGIAAIAFAKPERLALGDAELAQIGTTADPLLVQRADLARQWWAIPRPSDKKRTPLFEPAVSAELTRIADALEPVDEALDDLIDRAIDLRGKHLDSLRAKARLIQYQLRVEQTQNNGTEFSSEFHLMWSLCEDLTGEAL